MSYQVLARKWRPRNFEEVVGQQHVLRPLINALTHDRLHHAYLFTGTRGVGKTTLARIFAKSLNCETGVTAKPCGVCSACTEIDSGRFVDLIEVDAASRTGVDDTRDLLDNVQYAPTRGRYKVYLIDEVHMFSKSSFNALLKTLEEPPPHVKFLLATTDPQKLPVTILSRCLQFNLKRLQRDEIQGQLAHILQAEGVAADDSALELVARAAEGSMRDGLSLLDQAISFGAGEVREATIREMLGVIERRHVIELLGLLAQNDGAGLLARSEELAAQAPDYAGVLAELASALYRVSVLQVLPQDAQADEAELVAFAQQTLPEEVQLWYQIALRGREDLKLAPDARVGFEMALLRMLAFRPVEGGESSAPPSQAPPRAASHDAGGAASLREGPKSDATAQREANAKSHVSSSDDSWDAIVAALNLRGLCAELARNCQMLGRDGNRVDLELAPHCANLLSDRIQQQLQEALCTHLGASIVIKITVATEQAVATPAAKQAEQKAKKQARAEQTVDEDPAVQALLNTFDGELLKVSPTE
jgi:DNA polymerase-3 subunit gamma/tau